MSLVPASKAPWGRILWRADADKMGREGREVMTEAARDALATRLEIARLTGCGQPGDYLFPASKSSGNVTKRLAITWMERAERIAGLEHRPSLGWHGYRRLWVTTRKHHADADLCRLGGGRTLNNPLRIRPDLLLAATIPADRRPSDAAQWW